MATSIREQIVDNVVSTLEGITTDNGYDVTIRRVERTLMLPTGQVSYPIAFVIEESEEKTISPQGFNTSALRVRIAVATRVHGEEAQEMNSLLASIEKALLVDAQRSALAIDTKVVGNVLNYPVSDSPWWASDVLVDITYRHAYGDPYSSI